MPEVQQELEPGEKILWSQKPIQGVLRFDIINNLRSNIVLLFLVAGFMYIKQTGIIWNNFQDILISSNWDHTMIAPILVFMILINSLGEIYQLKIERQKTTYIITNQRIIEHVKNVNICKTIIYTGNSMNIAEIGTIQKRMKTGLVGFLKVTNKKYPLLHTIFKDIKNPEQPEQILRSMTGVHS